MNNKTHINDLTKLRTKWNLTSAKAQKNKVKYVLDRAQSDVMKVVGPDAPQTTITEWQAECLDSITGIGTHEAVTRETVNIAVTKVQAAFEDYPEGSLFHHVGVTVAEEVVAAVESEMGITVTDTVDIAPAPTPETVPGYDPNHSLRERMVGWGNRFGLLTLIGAVSVGGLGIGMNATGSTTATASPTTYTNERTQTIPTTSLEAHAATRETYTTSYTFSNGNGNGNGPTLGATNNPASLTGEAAFQTALTMVGTPYVFGGSNPGGFDCSGLIKWAYAQHGIPLGHGVQKQNAVGTLIAKENARLGDLIIMSGHNGFWAGDGMILDAPTVGGYVSVRPIWTNSYWIVRVTN